MKLLFFISFLMFFMAVRLNAQNDLDVIKNNWLRYSDAPNAFYHFLSNEAYKFCDAREDKISKIFTKDDVLKRQTEVCKTMWKITGPFPEKTPLNARITGIVKKKGYRIENLIYESLPGFYVTATLFVPENVIKPAPAILFCSGHSSGVYRLPLYQQPLLNLVKKGFIVLAIDPLGQGERLQYFDPATGESSIGGSTKEHSYPAVQVFLTGQSIARYFLWDGIRGIDYLVSRREVDPKRIGVHGLSGGGTQAAYISALDERVAASACAGFITSYRRLIESVGVQDGEQNFYHGLSEGIDHADFIEARAPKPTLIMATTNDFFSIQGSRETYKEVKRIYELLGRPDNVEITEDDFGHGYTKKNREAMYAFFQNHLQLPGSSAEEEIDYPSAQELQKTSTGQLSTSLGGETVFSLNRNASEKLIDELQNSRNNPVKFVSEAVRSAKEFSGYREPLVINEPVFTGRIQRDGYIVEKYFVNGEGEYPVPYLLFIPDKPNGKALIYLNPSGKSAEANAGGELEWFVRQGFTVLAPDLPGIGEMESGIFKGDADIDNVSYNLWFTSTLIGRSIVGIRAGDVVRLTRLLLKMNKIDEVYGLARKELTTALLYAAAFEPAITRVALIEPYSSYRSIVLNRFYNPHYVYSIVPGALTAYDLPDLEASLAPRRLLIAGVTGGNGKCTDIESINKDLVIVKNAYFGYADLQLIIVSLKSTGELYNDYLDWIK
jgi:dienelactone hydrolase